MAVTVDITYRDRDGQQFRTYADVTLDSSYAGSGGEAVTNAQFGFATDPTEVRITGDTGGYTIQYDYTNKKFKAYWVDTTVDGAPMAEVTGTTDLDGFTFKVVATARG